MDQEFTVLENKMVGRNMYINRKVRDKKAQEVADFIGISESAYTKYERGESKITIDIIQKIAEFHKIDPMQLLMAQPSNVVENIHNSQFSIHGNVNTTTDNKLTELITTLIENQLAMNKSQMELNERIMKVLEKQNK